MRQSLLLLACISCGLSFFGNGQEPYSETYISDSPAQRLNAKGITMTLSNVQPLSGASGLIWAEVTGNHFAAEITEIIGPELLDAVAVSVSLVAQDPPFLESTGFPAPALEPNEQTIKEKLTFDAAIFIRSVVTEHDVNRFIMGAFNSDVEQVLYIAMLKATGDVTFADASDVTVTPASSISLMGTPDSDGRLDTLNNDDGRSRLSTELIVGVALVCFSAIALAAFFLYTRTPPASLGDKRNTSVWEMETGTWAEAISPRNPYPSIGVENESLYRYIGNLRGVTTQRTCDEFVETGTWAEAISPRSPYPTSDVEDESLYTYISNLRGVTTQSTCEKFEDECSYASPSGLTTREFDYKAQSRNAPASVVDSQQSEFTPQSGFVMSTYASYLTSEAKKLSEFQVNAPPGDLGLVLGASVEGIAIVEEITRFSPLIGQVREGDRLVALDGRDITTMSATTLSQLVASKEYNQVRRFMFARPEEYIP